jgi:hypothetical protein
MGFELRSKESGQEHSLIGSQSSSQCAGRYTIDWVLIALAQSGFDKEILQISFYLVKFLFLSRKVPLFATYMRTIPRHNVYSNDQWTALALRYHTGKVA